MERLYKATEGEPIQLFGEGSLDPPMILMENIQLFFGVLLDSQILMENLQLIGPKSAAYEEMPKITCMFSS